MPVYTPFVEYTCPECGAVVTVLYYHDAINYECRNCKWSNTVKHRVIQMVAPTKEENDILFNRVLNKEPDDTLLARERDDTLLAKESDHTLLDKENTTDA